jgi:MFS family permease
MPQKPKIANKNRHSLIILYFLGLLLAVSTALPAYAQSNFLGEFVSFQMVSLFFVIANALTVLAIGFFPKIIEKITNYFTAKAVIILYGTALLGLTLSTTTSLALISIILLTITTNLIWINMDVLVENFSANAITGRIRTVYMTFINAGWIFSPLLTSFLIGKGEYTLTFLVAGFLVIPFFLIFIRVSKNLKIKTNYSRISFKTVIKKTWQNKNLRGIFFIALLLQLFYSSAVVYVPLYLHQNLQMDWGTLGIIFSIMLIPFMVLEIPAGIIADKYLGEKEILTTGIAILAISLFLFFYIKVPTAWVWALVLFLSRIGGALVEAMRETYFFKQVDAKDIGYINLFRMTGPLAYIIGPGLAILILAFFPLNYLFLFLSIIMLTGFGFIASLKDTK